MRITHWETTYGKRSRQQGVPSKTLRITAQLRNYNSRVYWQRWWFPINSKWMLGWQHVATRKQVWNEMLKPESEWEHMGIEDWWKTGYTGLLHQSRQYEIRSGFVSCGTKPICPMRGQDESRVTFRRQLIVRSNQSCVDVVEKVVSNHGRFCDLRSSFLDVSIRNEVITSNKNIPLQSPVCNEAYLFFYIYWVIYNLFYTECNSYDWSRTIIDWSRRVQCNDLSAINCGSRSKFII